MSDDVADVGIDHALPPSTSFSNPASEPAIRSDPLVSLATAAVNGGRECLQRAATLPKPSGSPLGHALLNSNTTAVTPAGTAFLACVLGPVGLELLAGQPRLLSRARTELH